MNKPPVTEEGEYQRLEAEALARLANLAQQDARNGLTFSPEETKERLRQARKATSTD